MFEISVKLDFSAAHNLRNYKGKCENLHGHNWHVRAIFGASQLNAIGMVMDFKVANKLLAQAVKTLDHCYLNNDVEYFQKINPTSENIAKFIFQFLSKKLKRNVCNVVNVCVWETGQNYAKYYED
ncbi:MAG: 6-carboxytetrahydropterin synthase QueD [Candidatus Omnitrophota bacterium]|nr:MAG: 6-carboxytetrahydropterin synthase QueD [Candidatus Omnitrophota bacterium]